MPSSIHVPVYQYRSTSLSQYIECSNALIWVSFNKKKIGLYKMNLRLWIDLLFKSLFFCTPKYICLGFLHDRIYFPFENINFDFVYMCIYFCREEEKEKKKISRNKKIKRFALIGLATVGGGTLIGQKLKLSLFYTY